MKMLPWQTAALLAFSLALPAYAADDDLPPPPEEDEPADPAAEPPAEEAAVEEEEIPPPPAAADEGEPEEADDADEGDEPEGADARPSGASKATAKEQAKEKKKKSKTGLGQDETVYVVQRKPVSVKYAFEFSPQFFQSVNDRFTIHTGGAISGLFHFRENFALQMTVGGLFGRDAAITREIREKESLKPELVQLIDHTWLATADLQWSPLYGKVSILNLVLGHFSLFFSIGGGLMGNRLRNQFKPDIFSGGTALPWDSEAYDPLFENPGNTNDALPFPPDQLRFLGVPQIAATIGGGVRFYLNKYVGFRFELRDYVQANRVNHRILIRPDTTSTVDISNTYMVQLGVSFLTPRLPLTGGRQ